MHKFRINDQNKNSDQHWGWQLSLKMVKLHEIKNLKAIIDTIKSNWKNRYSIKICQISN
jgi:hypothetical protein